MLRRIFQRHSFQIAKPYNFMYINVRDHFTVTICVFKELILKPQQRKLIRFYTFHFINESFIKGNVKTAKTGGLDQVAHIMLCKHSRQRIRYSFLRFHPSEAYKKSQVYWYKYYKPLTLFNSYKTAERIRNAAASLAGLRSVHVCIR